MARTAIRFWCGGRHARDESDRPAELHRRADGRDPARAAAEYVAEFRSDLEAFVQREVIENCTGGFIELAPAANTRYFGFVDAAGGSGGDSFAAAISHREGDRIIVDCLRERRPPFSPSAVIEELVPLLRSYRMHPGLSVTAGPAVSRLSSSSNTTSSTKPASRSKATCMSTCCRC